jgi:hypothetical protein
VQIAAAIVEAPDGVRPSQGGPALTTEERKAPCLLRYVRSGTRYEDTLPAGLLATLWPDGSTTLLDLAAARYVTFVLPANGGSIAELWFCREADFADIWADTDVIPLEWHREKTQERWQIRGVPPLVLPAGVWIMDYSANQVVIYDPATGAELTTFTHPSFANPAGAALVGRAVWIANITGGLSGAGSVTRLPFSGGTVSPLEHSSFNLPDHVLPVDAEVWVIDPAGGMSGIGSISRFTPGGVFLGLLEDATFNVPSAAARIGAQVWVPNAGTDTITRLLTGGTSAGAPLTLTGSRPFAVAEIAPPTAGDVIWVPNPAENSITRIKRDGSPAGPNPTIPCAQPADLQIVGDYVWVVFLYNQVLRLHWDGKTALSPLSGGALESPDGIITVPAPFRIPRAPGIPTLDTPADCATGQPLDVQPAWLSVLQAVRYHIQVSHDASFTGDLLMDDDTFLWSPIWPSVTGACYGGLFYWRVKAYVGGVWGDWSVVRSFSMVTLPPVLITPTSIACGLANPTFLWETQPCAIGYVVQVAHDPGFADADMDIDLTGGLDLIQVTIPGIPLPILMWAYTPGFLADNGYNLVPNQDYSWRVRARYPSTACGDPVLSDWSVVGTYHVVGFVLGMVAYWTFAWGTGSGIGGARLVKDFNGTNDGNWNAPFGDWGAGLIDGGGSFGSHYVVVPLLFSAGSTWTVNLWFKRTEAPGDHDELLWGQNLGPQLVMLADGSIAFRFLAGDFKRQTSATASFADGAWHMVQGSVLPLDGGSSFTVTIDDGIPAGSIGAIGTADTYVVNTDTTPVTSGGLTYPANGCFIGGGHDGSGDGRVTLTDADGTNPVYADNFAGSIDEVGFWDTDGFPDRSCLYNGGAGVAFPFTYVTPPFGIKWWS